ncbi:MAG: hypothetical protein EOP06_00285 [Proteobacteria bacterium]|nr:MAG: hypothetical protein EOP06_00285 [Pseudomonadota bacterium]
MAFVSAEICRANIDPVQSIPVWFKDDLARKASWLPRELRTRPLASVVNEKWNLLPQEIQSVLRRQSIPAWQIALLPLATAKRDEILNQLAMSYELAGPPATSAVARRLEQLLIFAGAGQLPTPGDRLTGKSLGAEGCTAAVAKYVLAQLMIEFPAELRSLPTGLAQTQSSVEMKQLFQLAARRSPTIIRVSEKSFSRLNNSVVPVGSIMIAQKPGGTHTLAWARVPAAWNWNEFDKIAIANTGLPEFGQRMILAQEYLTNVELRNASNLHNAHGPINSHNVAFVAGRPDLSDPRTNVYAVKGSNFLIIEFL